MIGLYNIFEYSEFLKKLFCFFRSDEPAHQQRGPLIVGNRAGIGAPQPSAPPTNPLQFISNQGNKNRMAEQAKQTMDKLKEQKHHGKQNKPEETDDIDWQSVCTQNSGLNAQNAVLNTQYF